MLAKVMVAAMALGSMGCRPSTDLVVAPREVASAPVAVGEVPPPRADGRLPDDIRPRRYRLTLEVDPAAKRFRGEVRIDLEIARPTTAIVLHGSGFAVEEVEISSGERLQPGKASFRRAAGAERGEARPEELVIETPDLLAVGTAELRIAYQAPLDDKLRGLYRMERSGKNYAVTQLEPADARRVFPCFDDPIHKAPFELSVIVPRGMTAFANAPLLRERDAGEDPATGVARTRFDFEPSKPLPAYLFALAVGPFDAFSGPSEPVPIRLVAPAGMASRGSFIVSAASELLERFVGRFGTPYPYAKLDLVAVPSFAAGAMENAGLITFREELLLVDADSSALARRRAIHILAHELAHQWFGDLVTLRWWDDLWLNEGFATYFASSIVDEWRPDTRAELGDFSRLGSVMALDALDAARRVREEVRTVYEAEEAFDAITYSKGSAVIGMLRSYLGDDAFGRGIQLFLSRHAHGHASAEDLFRALGDAAQRDVGSIGRSFVDQPGVPLIRMTSRCVDGRGFVSLEQQRHRLVARGAEPALWSVPVCLRYAPLSPRTAGAADIVETSRICVPLASRTAEVELDSCPAWVLPNDDHRGYYRYALPPDAMASLWRVVRQSDTRTRLGVLSNAWALVQSGDLPAGDLLTMVDEARTDRSLEAVSWTAEFLDHLGRALVNGESRPAFERWVSGLLGSRARDLGWRARPGEPEETKLLRETVLDALALHTSDAWVRDESVRQAKAYLRDPAAVDPDIAAVALRAAARAGALSFEALLRAIEQRDAPEERIRIVRALGSFTDAVQIHRAHDLLLDGRLRVSDARYLIGGAAQVDASRDSSLAWVENHFDALVERSDGMRASGMLAGLARACTSDARARGERIDRPLVTRVGGSLRRLDEWLEGAAACIDLRSRQAGAVSRWFASRPGDRRARSR